MKIIDLKYQQYSFPFTKPLKNSSQIFYSKEVIILTATDNLGNKFLGEIAPLQWFSQESIEDCKVQLDEIIDENIFLDSIETLKKTVHQMDVFPSLLFGLEKVLFQMELKNKIVEIKNSVIKNNCLIGIEEPNSVIKRIHSYYEYGFDTIKIKVGISFDEEYLLLQKIFNEFGDKLKIRLDVNGNWSLEQALEYSKNLEAFNIQYLEEPVKSIDDIFNLAEKINLKIAPDESISNSKDAIRFIESGMFEFIVLKPSIRLGINESIKIIEKANENNVKVIITSAYETALGKSMLLYLASLTNHNCAHGLNTETLGQDIIKSDIDFSKPNIVLNENILFK